MLSGPGRATNPEVRVTPSASVIAQGYARSRKAVLLGFSLLLRSLPESDVCYRFARRVVRRQRLEDYVRGHSVETY